MPRWRPLPDELDPQIREFTSQLRRLVDRSGMSVATIADRTGYSKSSWERYLGGRLLPPRGATHALGDVTGTDIRHLETMWELAERAWSRDEMRHDVTMEAIRVAQAREALGEFWDDEPAKGRKWGRGKDKAREKDKNRPKDKDRPKDKTRDKGRSKGRDAASAGPEAVPKEAVPKEEEWKEKTGEHAIIGAEGSQGSWDFFEPPSTRTLRVARGGSASAPAPPASPATDRPPMDDETAVLRPRPLPGQGGAGRGSRAGAGAGPGTVTSGVPSQRVDVASWGTSGETRGTGARGRGAANSGSRPAESPLPGQGPPAYPGHRAGATPGADGGDVPGVAGAPPGSEGDGRSSRGRRAAALLGGAVGVFAVIGAGVLVFGLPGGSANSSAAPSPSVTSSPRDLPAGVKCQGDSCTGKDPEKMGCGGQNVKSSSSAFVGPSMVEVRYSKVCKAAWGRITGAAQGDNLKISAGGEAASDKVGTTNDAYTEMVAVTSATEARACATLVAGTTGCTKVNGSAQSGTEETAGSASSADPAAPADTGATGDTGTTDGTGTADNTGEAGSAAGTGDALTHR